MTAHAEPRTSDLQPAPVTVPAGTTPDPIAVYTRRVLLTDVAAVVVAVAVAYVIRFEGNVLAVVSGGFSPSYLALSVALAVIWIVLLAGLGSRDPRLIGSGPAEYLRVLRASGWLFGGLAVCTSVLQMEISRGYIALAAPLGIALLLTGRYGWRCWLRRRRRAGWGRPGVLVVGPRDKAADLIEELGRASGYDVLGVCTTCDRTAGDLLAGVPVVGGPDQVADAAVALGARVVAICGADAMTAGRVRDLGWDLEGTGVDLAVAPSLTGVAGPRMLVQPVAGMPLLYVCPPKFTGARYVVKSVGDWLAAAVLVVLASPVLLVLAAAVKLTSPGPVFYRQQRIGRDGRPFPMIKFRSMVVDAHSALAEVLAAEGHTEIPMFYKLKDDPRVTRIGKVLRTYSLDELPQLFNVLRGEMSLVGPRPQIDREVAQYDRAARRRLRVKPGLTGLWQVSGRSELSADDGIRADVYYAENWTPLTDLLILARTVKVVLRGDGAY
ncbi:sugar transferase [Cellulomonas denverensis]|uniref:Sugar transferase n=1 Tax=Cellulomonas denverensis TaxID=264297 RepID=A0A7X6QXL2_9CELL|nr:sugar transferase [Cellulomonas denverensis]NKY21189.1 sugar transferase [Cellulomonas denverensis]GIG24478.1 polyprenyl glycosylphosphotransferase [Cellulomonas denverensis]